MRHLTVVTSILCLLVIVGSAVSLGLSTQMITISALALMLIGIVIFEYRAKVKQAPIDDPKKASNLETALRTKIAQLTVQQGDTARQLKETEQQLQHTSEIVDKLSQLVYTIPLECSYCSNTNDVEYDLGAGRFECQVCGHTNGVHTNISVMRTTEGTQP